MRFYPEIKKEQQVFVWIQEGCVGVSRCGGAAGHIPMCLVPITSGTCDFSDKERGRGQVEFKRCCTEICPDFVDFQMSNIPAVSPKASRKKRLKNSDVFKGNKSQEF